MWLWVGVLKLIQRESNISSSWGGGGELELKEFYSNKHTSYRQHLLTLTFFSPILGWIPRHCLPFFLTLMRTFGSWATLEAGRNNVGFNLFWFLPYVLPYVFVWGILTGNHIQPTYVMNPGCKSLTRKTDYKLCVRLSSKHNYGQFHG